MTKPITTASDVVTAALALADDAAQGRLNPATLEAQAAQELREVVGTVAGEGDPLWSLQCDIARQVLALGGVPADELSEWLAVARHRAGQPVDQLDGDQALPEPVSLPSEAHSPESGDAAPEPEPEPAPEPVADAEPAPAARPVPAPGKSDGYDPTRGWQPGNSRRY